MMKHFINHVPLKSIFPLEKLKRICIAILVFMGLSSNTAHASPPNLANEQDFAEQNNHDVLSAHITQSKTNSYIDFCAINPELTNENKLLLMYPNVEEEADKNE